MPKFLLIGLCFWTYTCIEEELESLYNLGEEIDIVLLENPSPNSEKIKEIIKSYGEKWNGYFRHVKYDNNIVGEVVRKFYRDNKDFVNSYDRIMLTEMDTIVNKEIWHDVKKLSRPKYIIGSHQNIKDAWSGIYNDVKWSNLNSTCKYTGIQLVNFPREFLTGFLDNLFAVWDVNLGLSARGRGYTWIVPSTSKIQHRDVDNPETEDGKSYIKWNRERFVTNPDWWKYHLLTSTKVSFDITY